MSGYHLTYVNKNDKYLFIYWGFTPLSTLFQLYHIDSSLIHDPWVNKPVLGFEIPNANNSTTADSNDKYTFFINSPFMIKLRQIHPVTC